MEENSTESTSPQRGVLVIGHTAFMAEAMLFAQAHRPLEQELVIIADDTVSQDKLNEVLKTLVRDDEELPTVPTLEQLLSETSKMLAEKTFELAKWDTHNSLSAVVPKSIPQPKQKHIPKKQIKVRNRDKRLPKNNRKR